jgi:putative ABC transport system permease protein
MQWTEAVKIAVQSLWTNKLRTVFTLLGIMIGVASVIAVITLVSGANHYIATNISGYDADTLNVARIPVTPSQFVGMSFSCAMPC